MLCQKNDHTSKIKQEELQRVWTSLNRFYIISSVTMLQSIAAPLAHEYLGGSQEQWLVWKQTVKVQVLTTKFVYPWIGALAAIASRTQVFVRSKATENHWIKRKDFNDAVKAVSMMGSIVSNTV